MTRLRRLIARLTLAPMWTMYGVESAQQDISSARRSPAPTAEALIRIMSARLAVLARNHRKYPRAYVIAYLDAIVHADLTERRNTPR